MAAAAAPSTALATGTAGNWLHAWYDPVAGVKTFSQCMRLADLTGDGDYRLIIADLDKRMKLYKGTTVASVHALLDVPVALAVFYSDNTSPRIASVAVASGPFIYVYRNLRPYMKFTLPQVAIASEETAAWSAFNAGASDLVSLLGRLSELRKEGVHLSSRAQDILALSADKDRLEYLMSVRDKPHVQQTAISAMDTINREKEGDKEVSCLVVGTEGRQVLILDAACSAIDLAITLPSVPTHFAIDGLLGISYRINVACRDGVVYAIKDRQLMATRIECGSLPAGMVRTASELYIATIDGKLHSYHVKGKKNWSLSLPAAVTAMTRVTINRDVTCDCCAVAMDNGEVHIYNGSACVSSFSTPDIITGMRFGTYSREPFSLVLASRSGALTFKMAKRTASFKATDVPSGPPPEQDIPIPVPKKTKLYLDQMQRERDQAREMHRIFQRDLCRLRLATARAYVKTISDGGSALASLSGASLRMNASVAGLGPNFKIITEITNVGTLPAFDVSLFFAAAADMYLMPQASALLPMLVPGVRYTLDFLITNIDRMGSAGTVRCIVLKGPSSTPAINAIISIPVCQPAAAV